MSFQVTFMSKFAEADLAGEFWFYTTLIPQVSYQVSPLFIGQFTIWTLKPAVVIFIELHIPEI